MSEEVDRHDSVEIMQAQSSLLTCQRIVSLSLLPSHQLFNNQSRGTDAGLSHRLDFTARGTYLPLLLLSSS